MLEIVSKKASKALGPYSQGVKAGSFLFVSGQIPVDVMRFSGKIKPARQTVEASRLPLKVQIEMSCIAVVEEE